MGVTGSGIDAGSRARLGAYLSAAAGADARIDRLELMSGGAIQENHLLDLTVAGGAWPGSHALVLRRDAASGIAASHGRADEFHLLRSADKAGVMVPKPCVLCEDNTILGGPFFIMHRVAGETAGHKLVKAPASDALVREIGANLARIHEMTPEIAALGAKPDDPAAACIAQYENFLDEIGAARPALEWGLAWLARNKPASSGAVFCHRDYRTGNLMIAGERLAATLDWEFAGWSDPLEDIGWFLAKCWRFGRWEAEAGGLGGREAFYAGYEAEAGRALDRTAVFYWEVMAHVRWAVIALQQAHRHLSGKEESLELALTGHVVPELEVEILSMTAEV